MERKWYRVYDGKSDISTRHFLTEAEVVEFRRLGYRVTEE
jgi:hypothetical protein